jgi:hypothetical protein
VPRRARRLPGGGSQGHARLGLPLYAHASSPIRRFADLYNQHVLFGSLFAGLAAAPLRHPAPGAVPGADGGGAALGAAGLAALNARCAEVKRYHSVADAMALAYACRGRPRAFHTAVQARPAPLRPARLAAVLGAPVPRAAACPISTG